MKKRVRTIRGHRSLASRIRRDFIYFAMQLDSDIANVVDLRQAIVNLSNDDVFWSDLEKVSQLRKDVDTLTRRMVKERKGEKI